MATDQEPTTLGMAWEAQDGNAQAVKVRDTVSLSGQVRHDDRANVLGVGDMEVQMRTASATSARCSHGTARRSTTWSRRRATSATWTPRSRPGRR
jgi:hypothetical protein